MVKGDCGTMSVTNPIVPQNGHLITVRIGDEETHEALDRRPTYGYQLDAFLAAVETGEPPLTDAEDGVRQMQAIDACYRAAGLPVRGL
jgi:predicted dehydrogenase